MNKLFLQPLFNAVKKFNAVIAVIVISAFYLTGCSSAPGQPAGAPPPPSLPVATISAGDDTTYQEYPASLEGATNVEIRPQVGGTLEKVFVDEGAFVSAGQPLFKINDLPYQSQLNNAQAALHAAEAAQTTAQLEVEKLTPLVENKVVSDYQLKTAKAAFDAAKANIEQAKANVSMAQINLGYTLIKAPVSGYIGLLGKKQGSLVSPADVEALTLLSDVQNVHVYFSLAERDFVTFKSQYPGATLNDKLAHLPPVTLLLADNTVYGSKGKIDVISGQFDRNTGSVILRANFPNPQGLLRSGNTGKVRLSLAHKNALSIPQSATVEVQDKVYVFAVLDSNKVAREPVTIVGKNGTNYIISDGIKPGDRIVLSGLDRLQEGMVIHPEKAAEVVTAN